MNKLNPTMANPVKIDEQDLYLLLGSALRYALPRYSYVTAVVADMIVKYKGLLDTHMLENYLKDIDREMEQDHSHGMYGAINEEVWSSLAEKLNKEIKKRGK